ncbi:MAG: single-stranded-DNA-specific exonuclease RecJ [Akkermansiaceae bacterium]|nr:single-stranded-DNA-specific exonuclease RecJ [Akkermansiaceae bacterium]
MRAEPFRWIARGEPFHTIGSGSSAEFPAILEHLILQRGLPVGDRLESFLRPRLADLADPFLIPGMRAAVERILLAVDRGEQVCIFGDYDVDGVTSIAIMRRILRSYGLEPRHFIPRRGSEGYGLNRAALERCMREGPKPDLLIAVDCGTVSVAEVAELNEKGVDVVIVDHHEPAEELPAAVAVVNPKRGDDFTYLCAAGVAFKVGHALLKTRQVSLDLKELLDLVAVATIADIVPMVGENRLLVRHGLRHLPGTLNPGLRALQEVTGMNGHATSMDVGFRIGPRLNAAGRMDVPEDALETLITDCRRLAMDLALKLDDYNRARQEHENLIRRQALEHLQRDFVPNRDPVIVIGSREWHPGVVGIVASRLMRQYHKPTFVIAIDGDGIGKGSGRSIEGVSLVEAIRACGDDLLAGGGHAMAAGLSIEEARLPSFRDRFAEYVRRNTNEDQLKPTLYYDAEISFGQLCLEFMDSYDLLQPFGNGNPQPVFISRGISLSRPPVRMKNQHLRFMLRQGYHEQDAVFFGGGEKALPDPPWDVAFTIDRNTFRGRTTLQLIVQDVRGAVPV